MYLAININTHEIIVAELSASNVIEGEGLPNLLKQTRRKINEISADGVDDTKQCYEIIRIKR
ncbi:Mobile element protein [Candidatus Enterovibrio altilux]|uniref:Mobile element protein n=1 Tax=Candidatus Enterovibrio altilux TaxID=1927128 RepID=A0A291B6Q3_9GAMM|nr:Mobile element protein [Candidatus Enterovibrio luxaltus]